ncbi:hypothetical protein H5410_025756 [Solanum commersonii]|uniref:Uncharacterized protein n=1 Tax=Solanum commersonii TaxID=4109 RepID=A0A9J5YWT0_SOLCO|nr:hypothetical protein H5410_025756 [Solanum commersonii]
MQIVINIITLSSFSLASINFGGTTNKHQKNSQSSTNNISNISSFQLEKGNYKKSQIPKTKSNFYTFVKEHDQGESKKSSSCLVHQNNIIDHDQDGIFSDYIKKFHKRNQDDLSNLSAQITNHKASNYIKKFHEKNCYESLATAGLPLIRLPPPPKSLVNKATTAT